MNGNRDLVIVLAVLAVGGTLLCLSLVGWAIVLFPGEVRP